MKIIQNKLNIETPLPTQPLRYIGSKYRMTPILIRHLHLLKSKYKSKHFREAFTGTASVAFDLMKTCSFSSYKLNDIDPAITCYLMAIRDYPEQLERRIVTSEFSKLFYAESVVLLKKLKFIPFKPDEIVDIAYRKLFVHRYSFSGLGVKSTTPVTKGCNRWNDVKLVEAIRILHIRAKNSNLVIENSHYTDTIGESGDDTLIYLDPPYVSVGEHVYQYGFNFYDHIQLAESIKNSPHPFILSYDNHELVLDLYSAWTKITKVTVWHSNQNSYKEELIITNKLSNKIIIGYEKVAQSTKSNYIKTSVSKK